MAVGCRRCAVVAHPGKPRRRRRARRRAVRRRAPGTVRARSSASLARLTPSSRNVLAAKAPRLSSSRRSEDRQRVFSRQGRRVNHFESRASDPEQPKRPGRLYRSVSTKRLPAGREAVHQLAGPGEGPGNFSKGSQLEELVEEEWPARRPPSVSGRRMPNRGVEGGRVCRWEEARRRETVRRRWTVRQ